MGLQGNLRDMSVADLIQHNCQEGKTARITLRSEDEALQAALFIERGRLVHAEMGDQRGEEVVYAVLGWEGGTFTLAPDIAPPARTIGRSYTLLLLEGMRRIDEEKSIPEESVALGDEGIEPAHVSGDAAGVAMMDLVRALKGIDGVKGVVFTARDGVVIAHDVEGNPEKQGAVAVFVGHAALQAGGSLDLGAFRWATVVTGKDITLVIEKPDYYVGLLLSEQASPVLVASKAQGVLE